MKTGRVLLLGLAALLLLLAVAVAVAFSSGFQTWAARRALAGQTDYAVTLGSVSAGLNRVAVEQVRVVRAGAVLTLPAAEVDLPLYPAAMGERVLVRRLVARGWTLDLTKAQAMTSSRPPGEPSRGFSLLSAAWAAGPAPAAVPGSAAFAGIFDHLRLPVDLALDGVDLAGEVLLPAARGRPAARAKLTITGGGLAAGHPGKFDYTVDVAFEGADAPVRELAIRGTLGVVMENPRTISRLVAATAAEATGPKVPAGVKLTLDLSAAHSAYGENYAASVSSGAKQLAAIETSFPAGASHLAGNWRLDMRDSDLAPFSFGQELPAFEAAGEGRFDTDTAFVELHASGRINASANRLHVVNPQLAGMGLVHLVADFDFAQRGDATRVDRLAVTLEGARPVGTVRALQAFEFNLKTGELNVADPANDLLGVAVQGLPLAWLAPILAREGLNATGGDLMGELAASARNGGFVLRPKVPITVERLSVSRADGRPIVAALDVSLTASADYTPQGWQVEIAPFTAADRAGPVLTIEGRIGQLAGVRQPVKAAGKWSGRLPGLLAQPFAGAAAVLTAGDAQGDFAANLGEKQEFQFRLAVPNLAAAAAPRLPALAAELRLNRETDGRLTFSAPLRLEQDGRKSDLLLAGSAQATASGLALDARLTSDFLAIEDAQLLAAPFGGAPSPAASATSAPAVSPAPFWAGVTGQVSLALKKVAYGAQFQITDVTGVLRLDAGSLRLTEGRGGFDADSDVKVAAGVTFRPAVPMPYTFAADVALNNFATAPAFRAVDPAKPPTVDARINLTSRITSAGVTVADLATRARGDLLVTSKGGIFRGLSADLTDRIQRTQSRVTAIASFLGVVPDDYVNKTRILADIARALSEIPFDQLSVTATRDASLNVQLKDFTVISPEVRIVGEGSVRYVEGVPVLAQPMEMQLKLGARGKLGDLIRRAGLLEKGQDNLGYAAFSVPLRIGGTMGNPDTNEIRTALLNSALERSGLLDSLLGK